MNAIGLVLCASALVLCSVSVPVTALPPSAERAYQAVASRFDRRAAMEIVTFMQQYWRVAGNPGFNVSLDHIRDRLHGEGFDNRVGLLRVDEYAGESPGWDHEAGTVSVAATGEVLLSRERDRVSLAINSFPTQAGGLRARVVDVGKGDEPAFARVDVRGAVVLGDADLGRLWRKLSSHAGRRV